MKSFKEWLLANEQGASVTTASGAAGSVAQANPQQANKIVAAITDKPKDVAAAEILKEPGLNASLKKTRAQREIELAKTGQPTTMTSPVAPTV